MKRYVKGISFLMIMVLFFHPYPVMAAMNPSSDVLFYGADVSENQKNVNFEKMYQNGLSIVYIRTGEGNTKDSWFSRNYKKSKNCGINVGFYHSLTARSVSQAKKQAEFFADLVNKKTCDCKLAVNIDSLKNINHKKIATVTLAFLKRAEAILGKEMILYCSASKAIKIKNQELLEYQLWISDCDKKTPSDKSQWVSWTGWQYSKKGHLSKKDKNFGEDYFSNEIFLSDDSQILKH